MAQRSKGISAALTLYAAGVIAAPALPAAAATEVCRFAGTTQPDGQVAITARVDATGGVTKVDVAVTFEAPWLFLFRIRYLVEEISTWRAEEMQSVAVNTRYLVGDHIVRQQWDAFQRGQDGLQAQRVQAKTLADLSRRHPGFVGHWDPATFGSPWLQDYPAASPERRADLDLKASPVPARLSSPLAMAFYWIRWLPHGGGDVPVFLPGFKADKLVDIPVSPLGGQERRASIRYPPLTKSPASIATAVTSPDGRLLQLAFDVHEPRGSASGVIHQEGCQGAPVRP